MALYPDIAAFRLFLDLGDKHDVHEYYRGHLSFDRAMYMRGPGGALMRLVKCPELDEIADLAMKACVAEVVHLVQERVRPNVWAYQAVKR